MGLPVRKQPGGHHLAIRQMGEALEAEITATRKRPDRDWKAIGIGKRLASSRDEAIYAFRGAGHLNYRPGTLLQLRAGRSEMRARVVNLRNGILTLGCPQDVGPKLGPARVYRDPSWLLVAQCAALRALPAPPRLARLLLDPGLARMGTAAPSSDVRRAVADLNAEQTTAVRRAVASELTYVWGPPGTGKTRTLSAAAEALYRRGETVLLVAPTNAAVDHLLLAVADRLRHEPALKNGRVLRLGPIQSGELNRRYGQHVDLQRAVRARVSGHLRKHVRAIKEVLRYVENVSPAGPVEIELRRRLRRDLRRLRKRIARRQARSDEIRRQLLDGARIVATTLHRAYLPRQLDRAFDAVVVDEASAASFPLVFLAAALRARGRMVVGGDPRQLPPVVKSKERVADSWLGRDAFEVGGLANNPHLGGASRVLSALVRQYRMHPTICRVVSRYAYGGRLRTARERSRQPWDRSGLVGRDPVLLIDTGPLRTLLGSGERPRANPVHRLIVGRLLAKLLGGARARGRAPTVAVLSPYKDQVAAHRKLLGDTFNASFLTVHKAQGREWDVAILDLPSASGVRPSPFARATDLRDPGARLNNVGASRAREQLIVIADCDYYEAHDLDTACIGRLLSLTAHLGRRVSCHQMVRSLPRAV